jgi:hypothetical protein
MTSVIAGRDPAIHAAVQSWRQSRMDHRVKPGGDEGLCAKREGGSQLIMQPSGPVIGFVGVQPIPPAAA